AAIATPANSTRSSISIAPPPLRSISTATLRRRTGVASPMWTIPTSGLLDDEHVAARVALHRGGDVLAEEATEHAVVVRAQDDERGATVASGAENGVRGLACRPHVVGVDPGGLHALACLGEDRLDLRRRLERQHGRRRVVPGAEGLR